MDLFDQARQRDLEANAPLAARMRPRDLDELLGQDEILGQGRLLRRAVESGQVGSLILYGPPGSGKTTIAHLIARKARAHFERLNAVTSGVADIRRVVAEAEERRGMHGVRTILFIDEIHRFNKAQQDALLPHVESGLLTLVGATTQNPYIECNPALVSRSRVFRLAALQPGDIRRLLERALADAERGLGKYRVEVEPAALDHLADTANGDVRAALNALELAVTTTPPGAGGVITVTLAAAEESIQQRAVVYDRDGDQHYDTISAFIKSIRGSDPQAAIYWLARMIYAGEDPRFVARRMIIAAAEDIGNADPQALLLADSAARAVDYLGLPEARIPLAQAAAYLAAAPKSNAAKLAIDEALADVASRPTEPVPAHLRDSSYQGAARLGHGQGYLYPHDFPGHHVPQEYLPKGLAGADYYRPSDQGREVELRERLARLPRPAARKEGEVRD